MEVKKWRVIAIRSNQQRIALDGCQSLVRAERLRRLLVDSRAFIEVTIEPDEPSGRTIRAASVRPPGGAAPE
ncbi:MAG: hypothetical protein EXS05_18925 [Planctomycetaceae bacterium]|nr:hypothetical protein [Planctomycetaceae bacterium]